MIGWLGQIYRAADEGLYVSGDSPDAADIKDALEPIADPRRAIEERAISVTMEHLASPSMGYAVKDVGKHESYDIHATKTDAS